MLKLLEAGVIYGIKFLSFVNWLCIWDIWIHMVTGHLKVILQYSLLDLTLFYKAAQKLLFRKIISVSYETIPHLVLWLTSKVILSKVFVSLGHIYKNNNNQNKEQRIGWYLW